MYTFPMYLVVCTLHSVIAQQSVYFALQIAISLKVQSRHHFFCLPIVAKTRCKKQLVNLLVKF